MTEKRDLADIGHKIGNVFMDVQASLEANNLTMEDLDAFERYVEQQDAVMSIFNPTAWMNGGPTMIKLSREQVRILKDFEKFKEMGRENIGDVLKFQGMKP